MPKVESIPENEGKCVCPRCPTWLATSCPKEKMEKLYCAKGKSACALEEKGCICMSCPVYSENQLTSGYFCVKGTAE